MTYRPDPEFRIGDRITARDVTDFLPVSGIISERFWPDWPGAFGWRYRLTTDTGRRYLLWPGTEEAAA